MSTTEERPADTEQDVSIKDAAARLAQEARHMAGRTTRRTTDITKDFIIASEALAPGQLVRNEYFTLFEAVAALEIMDSKMDTGYIPPDDTNDGDFDFTQALTAEQVLWIMDELLCQEISWLLGYPLSQTVFTSVHIDRITDHSEAYISSFAGPTTQKVAAPKDDCVSDVLHAYCAATVKTCNMVLDLIQSQNYCEEEDFVTHLFGRDLLPTVTSEELIERLDRMASDLRSSHALSAETSAALQSRLRFRRLFMQSLFGQIHGWQDLKDLLNGGLDETNPLGSKTPSAFTDKVQRRLASSTPPRPRLEVSWAHAQAEWLKLCDDIAEAARVTSPWIRSSPAGLQRAMTAFASQEPSTLPRAILQDIVFVDGKIADDVAHFDLVTCDVRDLVLAGDALLNPVNFGVEVTTDPRHKASRILETFMDGVLDEYMNMYRLLCGNRCRVRRALTQLVPIFETLEMHAIDHDTELEAVKASEVLDTSLGSQLLLRPLQSWTRYYKLRIMAETILMGFETDIYSADEIGSMYWYLSTLLQKREDLVSHIAAFTMARSRELSPEEQANMFLECLTSIDWHEAICTELAATRHLAAALWRLHALLLQLGLLKAPARAYARPELLYEARMKPYLLVRDPAPPSADELATACTLAGSVGECLHSVDADIKLAKSHLATLKKMSPQMVRCVGSETFWQKEIKKLETTCVATSVAVTQLRGVVDASIVVSAGQQNQQWDHLSVTLPPPGKRYHTFWTVPQLKVSK